MSNTKKIIGLKISNITQTLALIFVLGFNYTFGQYTPSIQVDSLSHIDYQLLHGANLNDIWGYVDELGNEYAIVGTTKGTSIVNVTNPSDPTEVFWLPGTESIWRDPCVYGNYAYVTTEAEDGMTIIDLSPLPQSNNLTSTLYTGPLGNPWQSAHTCFVSSNGFAYVFGSNRGNRGAIILDVHTDPMNPIELGVFDEWYVHDGYERNDTLYLAHIYDGFISLVNVTDKANPVLLGTRNTPSNFSHNVWPSTNGNYVYTTDEVSGAFIGVYDISDPANIALVDKTQNSPGVGVIPHNTHVNGDYLITSYYSDGIVIHDITYPYNIIKVGSYDTYPGQTIGFDGCWGVYPFLPSGTILAADITKGLFVLGPNYQKASYLEGIVRDELSNLPLNDAAAQIVANDQIEKTNSIGFYATGFHIAGSYQVNYSKVGYYPKTETVQLSQGILTTHDVLLTPIPPFGVNVRVYEAGTTNPITDASVKLVHPLITHQELTNGLGEIDMTLFYQESYEIVAGKWGYQTKCFSQNIDENTVTLIIELEKGYYDDFEFDFGWVVSGTATTGQWERGIPNPTNDVAAGFDAPYDCGATAFVTGNNPNLNADFDDIDKGYTILVSPQMDLTNYTTPYINYARGFFCYHGDQPMNDTLKIFLSNGTNSVLIDEIVGPVGVPMNYDFQSIPVSGLLPINSTMQLFVRISDEDPNINITEAAFDYFRVTESSTSSVNELANEITPIIYPNPTIDNLTISNLKVNDEIFLFDLQGTLLKHEKATQTSLVLNLKQLQSGPYFIRVNDKVFKVVKE
ncbi:MAG: choice-of-anchor B family protein [Crocinitomicaceae bacterium]|nr:choice-of-anchor B family protein [Crocinitomicaceae bacterium]